MEDSWTQLTISYYIIILLTFYKNTEAFAIVKIDADQ
jgi:hypothetical protein